MKIVEEIREGRFAKFDERCANDIDECMQSIDKMDGLSRSLVCIERDDLAVIIGGGDGDYVFSAEDDSCIKNLLSSLRFNDQDEIEIVAGGQTCAYQKKYIVVREEIKMALQELFNSEPSNMKFEVIEKEG